MPRGDHDVATREGAQQLKRLRSLVRELGHEVERLEGAAIAEAMVLPPRALEQLLEIAASFLAPDSVLEALDRAMLALLRLTGSQRGFIAVDGVEREAFGHVEEELLHPLRRRLERVVRAMAARVQGGDDVVVNAPEEDAELPELLEDQPQGPLVCVPFHGGLLYLERDPDGVPYEKVELAQIKVIGRFLVEALPVARAAEERRESQLQLQLLNRLYESLSQSLELDQVLDKIAEVTLEVTDAERAFILLMAGTQLYFGAARDANGPLPQQATRDISRTVCRKVVETCEGVFIYDMAEDPEFSQSRSFVSLQINSVVAVPLKSNNQLTGVLYVDSRAKLLTSLQHKLGVLTTVSQVASLAVESAKLYRQATVDSLTDTYVRSFFMLRLEEEIRRSQRYGRQFSLLVLDIDHFKGVNDQHGHQVGDDVLRAVAAGIKRSIRGGVDMPGRYGGDELVLLLPETNREGAAIVAERIRAVVAGTPVPVPAGGQIEVTLSIGVATFPAAGDSASALFASADHALYAAKQAGRNTFRSAP